MKKGNERGAEEEIKSDDNAAAPWFVYILRCADDTLYTGCAKDLLMRFEAHSSGKGAKYVSSRRPLTLAYAEKLPSRSAALKREYEIKTFDRARKLELIFSAKYAKPSFFIKNGQACARFIPKNNR